MNDDENTPLLASDVVNEHEQRLFSIEAEARRVDLLILDQIRFADIVDGLSFEDHPTEISFVLAVLLYLRREKCRSMSCNDLYDRWNLHEINIRGVAVLDNTLTGIWTSFLAEYRSLRNIKTVLWTPMHFQEIGNGPKVRVIDLLSECESDSPISLLCHPVIISAIDDAWKHGVDTTDFRSQSLLTRYDALGTPRVIHLIDWLAHVSFVVLVTHYLLYPIELSSLNGRQQYVYGPREVCLVLLPVSFALSSKSTQSFANISSLLVPLAFITSFPFAPYPEGVSFSFLQWAVFLQPLALHFPQMPSHLFFWHRSYSLPLAVLVIRGLSQILFPIIFFFLPLLLVAIFLLSLSLSDAFFRTAVTSTPPLETRFTFVILFAAVFLLVVVSIPTLAVSTNKDTKINNSWDRYSSDIGFSARRILATATVSYGARYTFPPPFNLLHITLVYIPSKIAGQFRYQSLLDVLEPVVWRIFVGPVTALIFFCLWRPC